MSWSTFTTGLTLRGEPANPVHAARKGDNVVYPDQAMPLDNLKAGGPVNVMSTNSMNFFDQIATLPACPTRFDLGNTDVRMPMFIPDE